MFGRSQPSQGAAVMNPGVAPAARTVDDLFKPAEWDRLSDADRAQLIAPFPALAVQTGQGDSLLRSNAPTEVQDWIAAVTRRTFQPQVAAAVGNWLDLAPANTHLFVGGALFFGTPQLVASVARQKLANWPTPSSYVYVPDPDALGRPLLLTLPIGTGRAFARALAQTLGVIAQQWGDAANRQQALTTGFDALLSSAPAAAQDYLKQLQAALAQIDAGEQFPWTGDDTPPIGAVAPEPDVTKGAPVVEASLTVPDSDLILQANGGVLIATPSNVNLDKMLATLVTRQYIPSDGLPPVPISLRVVLVADGDAYNNLWSNSDVIGQLFRYEVWTQDITPWTRDAEATYAAYATGVARYNGVPDLGPSGVARLVQEGARRTDGLNRSRLSTDLMLLHDIVVEAGNVAKTRGSSSIAAEDINAILEQRRMLQRAGVYWTQEAILSGESITPTAGAAVGQINGLGIIGGHPWEGIFAVPTRISATSSPSRDEQLVDIEREGGQADDTHVRGLLTMEGYFASRYGQKLPLALAARIRFEQAHGATGGDSASAAELFALLSALADLPIRRSIAVTGAVGQYGELQVIGGINFKIEGFWDLCRVRRNQGEQPPWGYGVIFPAANVRDLMLRPAVAQSIATEGWFNVWPVNTVDEALPLLMGVPAATVHERVEARLRDYVSVQAQLQRR